MHNVLAPMNQKGLLMIDTARGIIMMPWKQGVFDKVVPNWKMTKKTLVDKDGLERISWSAIHDDGLYIQGSDQVARIVQFSAPRYVFNGDNTNLIRNQDQLDQALSNIRLKMHEVLEMDTIPRWTRLDLVWNFIGNINEYIACFRSTKHPSVRKATRVFDGESISWKGRQTEIQIYDKMKEKTGTSNQTRTIVRCEIRKQIPKHSDKFDLTTDLCDPVMGGYYPNFDKCYKYYREQMTLLSPKNIPQLSSRSPMDFLAYLQANGLTDQQGVLLVDLWLANKSKASKYRIMKQLKDRVVRHKFINFHVLLPEQTTPKPVGYDDLARCA